MLEGVLTVFATEGPFFQGVVGLKIVHALGFLLVMAFAVMGCAPRPAQDGVIDVGMAKAQVEGRLGQPEQIRTFHMPAEGFFGPQESLSGLVAPGTEVEQWQYQAGGETLFVWFVPSAEQDKEWAVVATGRYPSDAVY